MPTGSGKRSPINIMTWPTMHFLAKDPTATVPAVSMTRRKMRKAAIRAAHSAVQVFARHDRGVRGD